MGALALLVAAAVAHGAAGREVTVRIDPAAHRIEGTATLSLARMGPGEPVLELQAGLLVDQVLLDGEPVSFSRIEPESPGAPARIVPSLPEPRPGTRRYTVRYAGTITIGSDGVFLSPQSRWYPSLRREEPATFRVDVTVPEGWEAVSEGSRTDVEEKGGVRRVYETGFPVEGAHLVAGPWWRFAAYSVDLTIAAYLPLGEGDRAAKLIKEATVLLDADAGRFGPYPLDRFDIVLSSRPAGCGTPGFTVLGPGTSLGHRIAHGWWGNGVLVGDGGDWSEGLATYAGEYEASRSAGDDAAAEFRRAVCAGDDLDTGKVMMVFHMLERRLGRQAFDAVLRDMAGKRLHERVSWDDWRAAFSAGAGEDLRWFFDQWTRRPGAPRIELDGVSVVAVRPSRVGVTGPEGSYADPEAHEVRGVLRQTGTPWRVRVPVVFEGEEGSERRTVEIASAESPFRIRLPFRPAVVRVDPDQDVFRRPERIEARLEPEDGNPETADPVSPVRRTTP